MVFGADDPWPWSETPWVSAGANASERPAVSDVESNVTHAMGFIGGTLSRRVPYENCIYLGWNPPRTCDLRYDGTSASLSGRVIEQSCGGGPVSGASVVLEELGRSVAPVPFLTSSVVATTVLVVVALMVFKPGA